MNEISLVATLLAAVSAFAIGGLWYSPILFLKAWEADAGIDSTSPGGHPARVFGTSFVFALVSAAAFAWLLGPEPELMNAIKMGAIIGALFVATSFGINYQFANRSFRLLLIDGGYHLVQFVTYGLVLGLLG